MQWYFEKCSNYKKNMQPKKISKNPFIVNRTRELSTLRKEPPESYPQDIHKRELVE